MALHDAAIVVLQFRDETAQALVTSNVGPGAEATRHAVTAGGLEALFASTEIPDHPCYTIVPRHEATLRILTLPSQDDTEIASMVALGAADLVPYPIEEMLVTHQCLARLSTGESRVLVALVRQEHIQAHINALQVVNREPHQILLSTACLAATASSLGDAQETALLHISPNALELIALHEGQLFFTRGISQTATWNLEDPRSREALTYEVRELLAAFRRERDDGQGAETLYISTDTLDAREIAAMLAEATGKPCQVATTPVPLADGAPSCPAAMAGAVAIAQGNAPLDLPLAPPGLKRNRTLRHLQQKLGHVVALAGLVVLVLMLWFVQALWQRQAFIDELQTQVDAVAPRAQGVAAKQHSLQVISRQVEQGPTFLELLAGLAEAAPSDGLNITRIQFDRETGLDLWGRAQSKDLVLRDFLGALRSRADSGLALFSAAHSLYETVGEERGKPVINYQITAPIPEEESDADAQRNR